MIYIGYACLTKCVPDTDFRSCTKKNATESNLKALIEHNLKSLDNIIDYNIKNDIRLFRISSDIIPFGSEPVNKLNWQSIFENELSTIGKKIAIGKIRVSMHPGQYTVINSMDKKVVDRAYEDLIYHDSFLSSLNVSSCNKIILHIGGAYGDKKSAIFRFIENYDRLPDTVKARLVIENDDRIFTIEDVLEVSDKINIPVVYDNLHHAVNSCGYESDSYWIGECKKTWNDLSGKQKIHYSQQNILKQKGAHTETIGAENFLQFIKTMKQENMDIMLEVKDKNISALKCTNLLAYEENSKKLQAEWARYKYLVMEKSPLAYNNIREMFGRGTPKAFDFYMAVESAISKEVIAGHSVNAAEHVWGYFKKYASESEKKAFEKHLEKCLYYKEKIESLKKFLYKLATKYNSNYILNSYYFL